MSNVYINFSRFSDFQDTEIDNHENKPPVLEDSLIYFAIEERITFFCIFLIIYIIACAGNLAAIAVTFKKKHRFIHKTWVISLALSDFITASVLTVWHLKILTQRTIVWTLGSFMCSFLPSVPIFGIICSSTSLVGIALDRYRNVINAVNKRWNPRPLTCIVSVMAVWCISIGLACPMAILFETQPLTLVYYDKEEQTIKYKNAELCLSFQKSNLQIYYICLMCLVFLPLLFIFLWLYYKIAKIIWQHRKPVNQLFKEKYENSVTVEATSQARQATSQQITVSSIEQISKPRIKTKTPQLKKKVRTFKIIIVLMLVFMVLRLPNWIYDTMKLSHQFNSHAMWIAKYIFIAFVLLHCALNPFLYVFLNQTIISSKKTTRFFKDFICGVCCCCFSNTEFEEFSNGNPFYKDFEKRSHESRDNTAFNKTT